MKKAIFGFIVLFSFFAQAQHTFSIVAVDPITGEIGSAGATCISQEDGALAISDIVLGTGAIHTQAFYLPSNQNAARVRMEAGDSPQEIIDFLVANDVNNDPSERQYGVVDLNNGTPRSAAFTGANCMAEFLHITGPNYSIQGNILISEDVVNDMETAFTSTTGTLADKLMAALQGAKRPGADSRCLSFGISSASAFLRVADPSDTSSAYGDLSLDLNVWITSDVFEPIDALQDAYDNALGNDTDIYSNTISLTPNPAQNSTTLISTGIMMNGFTIHDINGRIILNATIDSPKNNILINTSQFESGIYFISAFNESNKLTTKKLIIK